MLLYKPPRRPSTISQSYLGEMASRFHRNLGEDRGRRVRGQRTEIGGQGSTDYADFHRLKKMRDERTEVGEKQKSEVGEDQVSEVGER